MVDLSAVSRLFDTEALRIPSSQSATGSGISVDVETRYIAGIMILSVAELPHIMGSSSSGNIVTLTALIVSAVFLSTYCIYQVCRDHS